MLMPKKSPRFVLALPLLMLLLTGCGSALQHTSPPTVVKRASVPPLPAPARQPAAPPTCLPTCSAGALREFESWLPSLTIEAPPAEPAKRPTTD